MIRSLGLVLLLLLAALGAAPVAAAQDQAGPQTDRQIMVMLRLPPAHLRTGAGYANGYGEDAARGSRLRTAVRIAKAHGLALVQNWAMPSVGVGCFIMAVPGEGPVQTVVDAVEKDPSVAWSEPVTWYEGRADSAPTHNDALYQAQPAARQWPLAALHRSLTGRNVTVAVIDSGVDAKHPDLVGQVSLDRNFVAGPGVVEAHGTEVAGIIAARADNKVGIAGVAPGARIMALRACAQRNDRTLCDSFSLAKAIQFAVERKLPIINLSLSGPPGKLLSVLLRQGLDQGSKIVAAFDPKLPGGGFPASLPGVVAVTNNIDIGPSTLVYYAPGHDVPAPQPGGLWTLVDGSSFSAAHVSGLFALLRQQRGAKGTLASNRRGGGEIDICATFGVAMCGSGVHAQSR